MSKLLSMLAVAGLCLCLLPVAHAGLLNGGFENPHVADGSWAMFNENSVDGWETTSTDQNIEIWGNGFSSVSGGPVYAYEGRQFAEINATQFATLYQDVSGIASGSVVGFQFAHRGRSGMDSMRLLITDLGLDGLWGSGDDTTLFAKDYFDGNTAWGFYTSADEPTIVTLGNTIRFSYQALTTASGNNSIGNFIDAADFGIGVGGGSVPEPASISLMAFAFWGLYLSRRRKFQNNICFA